MAIGLFLAVVIGFLAAGAQVLPLVAATGVIGAIVITLMLKEKVWLLIPICGGLSGALPFLPLPFSIADLSKMYVFGMFLIFYALKVRIHKARFDWLDALLWLNLIYLFTVFVRNPVGVRAIPSDLVGGKPYALVLISISSWLVYSRVRIWPSLAKWYPLLGLTGTLLHGFIQLFTWAIPASVPFIARFYSGVSFQSYIEENFSSESSESERVGPLGSLGRSISPVLLAYFRPLSLLNPLRPIRFCVFVTAALAILLSGFRSYIFQLGALFFIASILHNGKSEIPKLVIPGIAALILLIVVQSSGFDLPNSIQRSLSFIPGIEWSQKAAESAEDSSEWRYQMWREVWTEPRWIKNKIFGDGFGFSRSDYQLMIDKKLHMGGFVDSDRTLVQKINGDFHNGPLSAIRFVGIVGLIFYTLLLFGRAAYAYRLYKDARGTPYYVPAILFAMTCIYAPFHFFLIFGAFNKELPGMILSVAGLRLLRNSLDDYQRQRSIASEKQELPHQNPRRADFAKLAG